MTPLLACRGLTRRFGGLVALDSLDLELEQGRVLGLIGPNGSGKTTFFNVVTGLFPASGGEIRFGGASITRLRPQAVYRAGVARTFQRSRLCLPLSIFDNLMIGNHQRLDHGLWFNLVRRAALRRQIEEGYAQARELIAIFDPPLAARLDEPSAGMTHEETERLMDDLLLVKERLSGLTIVLIEHEMSVIERITDRCVVLNYGRKIAEGTYAEVARDPQVRQAYLGLE